MKFILIKLILMIDFDEIYSDEIDIKEINFDEINYDENHLNYY